MISCHKVTLAKQRLAKQRLAKQRLAKPFTQSEPLALLAQCHDDWRCQSKRDGVDQARCRPC
jgi:hypothetical protein